MYRPIARCVESGEVRAKVERRQFARRDPNRPIIGLQHSGWLARDAPPGAGRHGGSNPMPDVPVDGFPQAPDLQPETPGGNQTRSAMIVSFRKACVNFRASFPETHDLHPPRPASTG